MTDPLFPYTLTIVCGNPTNTDLSDTWNGIFRTIEEVDAFLYGASIARSWEDITITEASPRLVAERLKSLPYTIEG